MYSFLLAIFSTCFFSFSVVAQELNFRVSVQTLGSTNSVNIDPSFFKGMEQKISDLLNTTKWTNDDFKDTEKIIGNFQLTLTEIGQNNTAFKAELVFQTERPVFNASYSTPLITLIDKTVNFTYNDLLPLNKTNSTFYDNLSSIVSFYAYIALGMDYDSFSINGGEVYFQKAYEIFTSLPGTWATDDGWKNDGGGRRNRYWLIENILNPRMRQFRHAFYEYHRLSLDKMYADPDKSRAVMLSALTAIGQSDIEYKGNYLIQIFGDAKKDEIIEIFKQADNGQKSKVKTIMVGMDFTKTAKYDVLD